MENGIDDLAQVDRRIISSSLAVRAIRDSRYHNTAYAIAELIDNSIEAHAGRIELLCLERYEQATVRVSRRAEAIAVFDDGDGMDRATLLNALRFGEGTRHESLRGIGKYGMGLPASSMSQCTRVDVWTWQEGLDSAWHSYIDYEEIRLGNESVPIPDQQEIDGVWIEAVAPHLRDSRSGTLVVWRNLDKIRWRAETIIEHTARQIGRIHRNWIAGGRVEIRAKSFLRNQTGEPPVDRIFLANDPLYLMVPSSTPAPWNERPMFRPYGDEQHIPITYGGREETVSIKYSIATPDALRLTESGGAAGSTDHGRHARHNIGVSVVREGREIVLENSFMREGGSGTNPENRWWGCEVSFGRGLDELFGVDHSKQMVSHFSQAARDLSGDDRPRQRILDEMRVDDDKIYEIVANIRNTTAAMLGEIKRMFDQRRTQQNLIQEDSPEKAAVRTATEADEDAVERGEETQSAMSLERSQTPSEEQVSGLTSAFVEAGQDADEARKAAEVIVEEGLAYVFTPEQLDGFQMFSVRNVKGHYQIRLNTDHRIYGLIRFLEDSMPDSADPDSPHYQAIVAIRLLLSSWAKMETDIEARAERARVQEIARDWGRQVDKALHQLREWDD